VAFARYQQQQSRVTIGYSAAGSSAAITALNPGVSLGSNLRSVSG
jgi:ABC-type phosphate transport system substrate-binding protein